MKLKIFSVLFICLMLSSIAIAFIPLGDQDSTAPAHISYVGHATISIVGNAGFLGLNATTGISWGSGTIDDPYIIDGWDIDASATHGIRIIGATSYFEISGCYIHDGAIYNGIHLNNTTNGVIRGNTLISDYSGIHLESFSENNTISSNSCSFNSFSGIRSLRSNSSSIENNLCFNNGYANIDLDSASNMTVANNTCRDGPVGIYLDDTFTSLPRCSINTVMNNTCHSNIFGIYLDVQAHNNTIESNTVYSNTQYGIFFTYQSNHNMISLNNISTNTNRGIFLNTGCYNNICWNNTLTDNNGGGTQAYDDGTNNWWNASTGYGNYWSDWTIPAIPDIVSPFGILDLPYIFGIAQDYYPRYILILAFTSTPSYSVETGSVYSYSPTYNVPLPSNISTNAGWLSIVGNTIAGTPLDVYAGNYWINASGAYGSDIVWQNYTLAVARSRAPGFTLEPDFIYTNDADGTVRFTDRSRGAIVDWFWNFGDGSTSTDKNPTHNYTEAGVYQISLRITDVNGHQAVLVRAIRIYAPFHAETYLTPMNISFVVLSIVGIAGIGRSHTFLTKSITLLILLCALVLGAIIFL